VGVRVDRAAAARVAVEELIRSGAHPKMAYSDDEDCLREIAGELIVYLFHNFLSPLHSSRNH
jgi:membrane protein required for beta-lactamase induction